MKVTMRVALAAVWCAGLAQAAAAQGTLSLSLDDALRRGVAAAPRVAEAHAREAAASAVVTSRETQGLPSVLTQAGITRTNHVTQFGLPQPDGSLRVIFPDLPTNYSLKAELDAPVYTGGRVGAAVRAAKDDVLGAAADRSAVEQDIRFEVAAAYWMLVTARESTRVLTQALARTDASVADVKTCVDTGFLPPNDLLTAQAQRARQAVQLIQAQNDAAVAELNLGRLVGADPGTAIALTSPVTEAMAAGTAAAARTTDQLVTQARDARPDRRSLLERSASFESTAEAARSNRKPAVGAFAAVQPARPNPLFVPRQDVWKTSWSVGVNVSWLAWDGGKAKADAAAATAQAEAVSHRVEDFDRLVNIEIRQRLLDLASGRAAIAASADAVAAASEAHRVVAARFQAGVATSTDVLDAESRLLEAELEQTRLQAGQRLAEARLLRALGTS